MKLSFLHPLEGCSVFIDLLYILSYLTAEMVRLNFRRVCKGSYLWHLGVLIIVSHHSVGLMTRLSHPLLFWYISGHVIGEYFLDSWFCWISFCQFWPLLTFIHAHTHAHMYTHTHTHTHTHTNPVLIYLAQNLGLQVSTTREIDWYIQEDTGNINGAYDESKKRDSVRERES